MFLRIASICLLISLASGVRWCKVFQAERMHFTEIENREQPFYDNLVSSGYKFSIDQICYKFDIYKKRVFCAFPRPLALSSESPYTIAEFVKNWNVTNPLVKEFPTKWKNPPPQKIYSGTDVQIDEYGRIWCLDQFGQ